jgi:hypothetical protein
MSVSYSLGQVPLRAKMTEAKALGLEEVQLRRCRTTFDQDSGKAIPRDEPAAPHGRPLPAAERRERASGGGGATQSGPRRPRPATNRSLTLRLPPRVTTSGRTVTPRRQAARSSVPGLQSPGSVGFSGRTQSGSARVSVGSNPGRGCEDRPERQGDEDPPPASRAPADPAGLAGLGPDALAAPAGEVEGRHRVGWHVHGAPRWMTPGVEPAPGRAVAADGPRDRSTLGRVGDAGRGLAGSLPPQGG